MRIPAFLGETGDEFDKQHQRAVLAEKRKVKSQAKAIARDMVFNRMRGLDISDGKDPWGNVKEKLQIYVAEVRDGFQNRIIKRDETSVRFDGKPLNEALPPFQQILATCRLDDEEMRILEEELLVLKNT